MKRSKRFLTLFLTVSMVLTGNTLSGNDSGLCKGGMQIVRAQESETGEVGSEDILESGETEGTQKETQEKTQTETQTETQIETTQAESETTTSEEETQETEETEETEEITETEETEEITETEEIVETEEIKVKENAAEDKTLPENMKEQSIQSLIYHFQAAGTVGSGSIEWTVQLSTWDKKTKEIKFSGDGAYETAFDLDDVAGMKNLGYIEPDESSNIELTLDYITVNQEYDLFYEDKPVLTAKEGANGLSNIWNVAPQTIIGGDETACLALDEADGKITFYAAQEETPSDYEATAINSLAYEVTVENSGNLTDFVFRAQAADWNEKETKVALTNADGDYRFTLEFDSAAGMKNLGYIMPIDATEMTVTVNRIVANESYELIYEEKPVLKPGVENANGLANIWNTTPQKVICSGKDAYLALDETDGALTLYTKAKEEEAKEPNASMKYVEAMGSGWNLGNSFDGFDSDTSKEDTGELAWGNPTVTRELISAVKAKGYDSIRMPMTVYRRYTVNENAKDGEYKYIINKDWIARYKEVVDWAVDEGMYVMVNIHHDSWIWLKGWDGQESSEEYRMYTDFCRQLSECMADEPQQVCIETINEPDFEDSDGVTAQQKLDRINTAAYEIIRNTKGNEKRMIIMPTLLTNYEKGAPLYSLISELNDEYIIATVHYYSEWVYSANLGMTGFDEELWKNGDESYTPRVAADNMMSTIKKQFLDNNIGVIIGEYGLLGYDQSEGCLQTGEELKYYEYMNEIARQNKVCLMFWDNGSGINRTDADYNWKKPRVGNMLESSMKERSSYTSGLDTIYFADKAEQDIKIDLTLNGNSFTGIKGLVQGTDYTYDSSNAVVTLKKEYINKVYEAKNGYGTIADLEFTFDKGAVWNEYLVKCALPEIGEATGSREKIEIPVDFKGSTLRRVTAYQTTGRVGPNSDWWNYLKYDSAFGVDYENGSFSLLKEFFDDSSVKDGLTKLRIELFDGQIFNIWLNIDGNQVVSSPELAVEADTIGASEIICLYAGETQIPAQYLYMPEGGSVYGTWIDESENNGMVTLEGWPARLIFDTKAHDHFVAGGIVLYYMDVEKYVDVKFGIKDAPVVENMELKANKSDTIVIKNIAEDAKLTYTSSNNKIVKVDENGKVTGKRNGTAVITVQVEQYNRTDEFTVNVKVYGAGGSKNGNDKENEKGNDSEDSKSENTGRGAESEAPAVKAIAPQTPVAAQPKIELPQVLEDTTQAVAGSDAIKTKKNRQQPESAQTAERAGEIMSEENAQPETLKETDNAEEAAATSSQSIEGAETQITDNATPLAAEPESGSGRIFAVIVLAVVLLGAGGVYAVVFRKKESR